MSKLIQSRASIVSSINRYLKLSKEIPENATKDEMVARISRLKEYFASYERVQSQIEETCGAQEIEFQFLERQQNDELYFTALLNFQTALSKHETIAVELSKSDEKSKVKQVNSVKLPVINLQNFSGKYEDWPSFSNLFKSLIHKSEHLSLSQKLHYLKANISSEPADLIRNLQLTDENYIEAWNLLEARYNNKRFIIDAHLKILFAYQPVQHDSPAQLRQLGDKFNETIQALKTFGNSEEIGQRILNYLLTSKLNQETRRQWELKLDRDTVPTVPMLLEFIERRWQSLEMASIPNESNNKTTTNHNGSKSSKSHIQHKPLSHHVHINKPYCLVCKKDHFISQCSDFKIMDYTSKTNHTQSLNPTAQPFNEVNNNPPQSLATHITQRRTEQVLFPTALVVIQSSSGNHIVRALIDSGSQASLITKSLASRLALRETTLCTTIKGLGNNLAENSSSVVKFGLSSHTNKEFFVNMTAFTIDTITINLPTASFDITKYSYLHNLQLADQHYNVPSQIELLIGADIYGLILLDGVIKGPLGAPIAQHTHFGWVIFGQVQHNSSNYPINLHLTQSIDDVVKRFWEIEELPTTQVQSQDEIQCETHFINTYQQNEQGRFIVDLPFKFGNEKLGNSMNNAIRRFYQVERRFLRDAELQKQYTDFMEEYLKLGHMERIPMNEIYNRENCCFYLPHHAVRKEDSTTTKLRVVFDGSSKTSTGYSLNDILHVGPTLQQDIISIMTRWRKHKIVFIADIEKMYRQILVSKQHTDFQRIVWRPSPNDPIQHYRLTTVTYGTSSAPYLAIKVLRQLAINHTNEFPTSSQIILRDFYVDDLMSGANSLDAAININQELIALLKLGKFSLRKWYSNSKELLQNIPNELHGNSSTMDLSGESAVKALGIFWAPSSDHFEFHYTPITTNTIELTKRMVLSQASRLFDPLGWLAPVVIMAKIIMQNLWLTGISWDEKLPPQQEDDWKHYTSQLGKLQAVRLDRWIGFSGVENVQLHGFADASSKAYAAVIYARVESKDGVIIRLLSAKTKVAPIKTLSIPRLELCGALLLARLTHRVIDSLNMSNLVVYNWTDSTIVLSWLRKAPVNWKTFIANRVSEIHTLTQPNNWRHISSPDNPADCASRGLLPDQLIAHQLWWSGPNWLSQPASHWPSNHFNLDTVLEARETKPISLLCIPDEYMMEFINRCSNLDKLLRITSYCNRFIANLRLKLSHRLTSFITAEERKKAMSTLVLIVQRSEFHEELNRCSSGDSLLRRSRLISLHPFVDTFGILRVGGRLQNSDFSYNKLHPIILPNKNHLSKLIIGTAHLDTCHGGAQLMMAHISNTYWIIGLRHLVREHIHRCLICFRQKAVIQQQLMGKLPPVRSTPSRAFLHSGVDYAGPIDLRLSKGRGCKTYKGYICLFICLVTKAMHLEAVSDLSSSGFIAAFRRFISRRGKCTDLYSDCGTNFVGANTILRKSHKQSMKEVEDLASLIAKDGTSWHFIPPGSPHFGGLWEAGVKSVKTHMRKIIGTTTCTYEEMATLLAQIEACLNSRPLCPMSNKIDDLATLTPGHFLVGDALLTIPEPTLLTAKVHTITNYNYIQQLLQRFWKIWSTEYLQRLQQRPKWNTQTANMEVGQLVLIKDERLVQFHPGADGLVRVVRVRCKETELVRPITKLCLLPVATNTDSL